LYITTVKGVVKKQILGKSAMGSRAIKPRSITKIAENDRPAGVVSMQKRPETAEVSATESAE
jgi:hypothetical protein